METSANMYDTRQEIICGYLDGEPIYRRYVSGKFPLSGSGSSLVNINAKKLIREDIFGTASSGGGDIRVSSHANNNCYGAIAIVSRQLYAFFGPYYQGGTYRGFIEYVKL